MPARAVVGCQILSRMGKAFTWRCWGVPEGGFRAHAGDLEGSRRHPPRRPTWHWMLDPKQGEEGCCAVGWSNVRSQNPNGNLA